jgi:hypothetical protein
MLGFDCRSHSCSHPLATPKVLCFHGAMLGCSHSNNLESDGYELLLLSTYGSGSKCPITLKDLELPRSTALATNLATGAQPLDAPSALTTRRRRHPKRRLKRSERVLRAERRRPPGRCAASSSHDRRRTQFRAVVPIHPSIREKCQMKIIKGKFTRWGWDDEEAPPTDRHSNAVVRSLGNMIVAGVASCEDRKLPRVLGNTGSARDSAVPAVFFRS